MIIKKRSFCSTKPNLKKEKTMEKKIILTIDDEKDNHEFIKSILDDDSLEVITALNGKEGLKLTRERHPALIILDVQMPVMDGFTTFRHLKADETLSEIPIVMLTGIAEKRGLSFSKEEMGEFYGKEPDEYLEKPIDPEKLISIVNRLTK